MTLLRYTLTVSLILTTLLANAQKLYWSEITHDIAEESIMTRSITSYSLYKLDIARLESNLPSKGNESKKNVISLPNAQNELAEFFIWDAPIMQDALAEKYPSIRTFLIQQIDDPTIHGRMTMTSKGIKAYISSSFESYFIYPIKDENDAYLVFKQSDTKQQHDFTCTLLHQDLNTSDIKTRSLTKIGDVVREYRLAISTTGEYSSYHGGNREAVLEAIVETVSQVNVVYENNFALRFILIDGTDELINLDASKDPFNNNEAGQMISVNSSFTNARVGVNNYDLGHVFATSGAGLASLRSICTSRKAQGATGIFPPEGKAFALDYVAHEFGHQLGSNHTFNNCDGQEVPAVAYEPGGGSTIMAYAGLCGPNNVQGSSDSYFHVSSLIQITDWLDGQGGSCADESSIGNSAPLVNAGQGGFNIPIQTPFFLKGEATDPDGDPLTYCWEQYNRGPQSPYGDPIGNAPSFRSVRPSSKSIRYLPSLSTVVNNGYNRSEVLPEQSRDFTFQLTARDNKAGGGAVAWDDISFKATDQAGPFVVTSQNESGIVWESNRQATVTWDVANTNQEPVNCKKVNIIMSRTFGVTFDIMLAENVDNDGSATFIVPDAAISNFARVQVVATDNIFYNVNKEDFKVVQGVVSTRDAAFEKTIDIFPNPSTGQVTIDLGSSIQQDAIVEVVDMKGKLYSQHHLNSSQHTINMDAPAGLYFLKIAQDQKVAYKKVVLAR